MYTRNLENVINEHLKKYSCITIIGPRQSGKTTLCRKIFTDWEYFSFESPDTREQFLYDPRAFLNSVKMSAVFDEVQKVPELLSYLQETLDSDNNKKKIILTGSNNL